MKLKSPLKFGGMLYISKSLFKNGGYLNIAFDILLYDSKDGELFEYGDIKNRDWICIGKEKASDKDIGISLIDENTGKTTEAPKGVTVKSSGNYYIISFKNIRSSSVYTKYGEVDNIENQKFVTNKAFYPQIALIFHGDFPKTASGNILVDYIAVTGAKTIKSSFEKHDFYNVVARRSTWAKVLPTIVQTPG